MSTSVQPGMDELIVPKSFRVLAPHCAFQRAEAQLGVRYVNLPDILSRASFVYDYISLINLKPIVSS
ncbi:hypothetical protein VN97_g1587 [Penicillium thymicola]|uniref:Uncharacterized protein n=1 Tax=Penicillium thymicola TaxID=293382 RepID=A0AAI9TS17_PENTH|nr:hypothetical protein VN97_g1587 [Penicillium thymicola]